MSAVTSAAAVANQFLVFQERDRDSGLYPEIDPMKLQKLVYYSHAWWLAFNNEPLFDDDVEAWPWGPVVRSLYLQFKDFKRSPIKGRPALALVSAGDGAPHVHWAPPPPPPERVVAFLDQLWKGHGVFTGVQLSNATHAPGEPWTLVAETDPTLKDKPLIPNDLIRDVFKQKLPA